MEYKRNSNYGRTKCFHCLLSPDRDDPIFIGINRLVAKGLESEESNTSPEYPCHVVNRFECPYRYAKGDSRNTRFGADDLFDLANIAFAVEIALAVPENTSTVRIKDKQDLFRALTDREILHEILEQGLDYVLNDKETFQPTSIANQQLQKYNREKIVDQFMTIKDKDKVILDDLDFASIP
jgi:hypothetical protein